MNNFIKLGIISFIFLASFLMISLSRRAECRGYGKRANNGSFPGGNDSLDCELGLISALVEAECPYKLRLRAGALFLHREDNSSRILAADNVWGHMSS